MTPHLVLKVALALALAIPVASSAASFDCSKAASRMEKEICASPELSDLDSSLGALYKRALDADKAASDELRAGQRRWLRDVRDRCERSACLSEAYQKRISEVQRVLAVPGSAPAEAARQTAPPVTATTTAVARAGATESPVDKPSEASFAKWRQIHKAFDNVRPGHPSGSSADLERAMASAGYAVSSGPAEDRFWFKRLPEGDGEGWRAILVATSNGLKTESPSFLVVNCKTTELGFPPQWGSELKTFRTSPDKTVSNGIAVACSGTQATSPKFSSPRLSESESQKIFYVRLGRCAALFGESQRTEHAERLMAPSKEPLLTRGAYVALRTMARKDRASAEYIWQDACQALGLGKDGTASPEKGGLFDTFEYQMTEFEAANPAFQPEAVQKTASELLARKKAGDAKQREFLEKNDPVRDLVAAYSALEGQCLHFKEGTRRALVTIGELRDQIKLVPQWRDLPDNSNERAARSHALTFLGWLRGNGCAKA